MKKIVQYWYCDDGITNVQVDPPKDIYKYDYTIKYKLRAEKGYILQHKLAKCTAKFVIISPEEESNWIEVKYDDLKEKGINN